DEAADLAGDERLDVAEKAADAGVLTVAVGDRTERALHRLEEKPLELAAELGLHALGELGHLILELLDRCGDGAHRFGLGLLPFGAADVHLPLRTLHGQA